jgi:hypothetical protein
MNPASLETYCRMAKMQAMMELLWAVYVDANPRLFEVYDKKAPRRGVAHAIFLRRGTTEN